MCLFTAIHNFCTIRNAGGIGGEQHNARHKRGEGLVPQAINGALRSNSSPIAYRLGKELYDRLKQLLIEHLQEIHDEARRLPNDRLLEYYTEEWD
jgi:hypothetical protein